MLDLLGNEVKVKKSITPKSSLRGCKVCPLNGKPKIFGEIKGREILILATSPSSADVRSGKPLSGSAGDLLWERARKLKAFTRSQCDVDFVVRCRPTMHSPEDGRVIGRDPSPSELHCCGLHTENQMVKAKPKVILLLGQFAQRQFMQGKTVKSATGWSERYKCRVVLAPNPDFMLHGVPTAVWAEFDAALRAVRQALEYPSRYGYLEAQDYKAISNPERLRRYFERVKKSKRFVACDVEDDVDDDGKPFMVMIGFCHKPGVSRQVFLRHPKVDCSNTPALLKEIRRFMLDASVIKAFHHGVTDVDKLRSMVDCDVRGYEIDGEYAEYLRYPDRKDNSLDRAARSHCHQFGSWKTMLDQYKRPGEKFPHMSLVPPRELVLYNGADCDVLKRVISFDLAAKTDYDDKVYPTVSRAVLRMMVNASFPLFEMDKRGILHDNEHSERLLKLFRPMIGEYKSKIALVVGDPDFDPTDDKLRWLLGKKLKLPLVKMTKKGKGDKLAVDKKVLETLLDKHSVVGDIIIYRWLSKLVSTYLVGFRNSADANGGYVKTRWKITGTGTGRLSSSGDSRGGKGSAEHRVNLQNIHGNPNVQNILVSTARWREIVQAAERSL